MSSEEKLDSREVNKASVVENTTINNSNGFGNLSAEVVKGVLCYGSYIKCIVIGFLACLVSWFFVIHFASEMHYEQLYLASYVPYAVLLVVALISSPLCYKSMKQLAKTPTSVEADVSKLLRKSWIMWIIGFLFYIGCPDAFALQGITFADPYFIPALLAFCGLILMLHSQKKFISFLGKLEKTVVPNSNWGIRTTRFFFASILLLVVIALMGITNAQEIMKITGSIILLVWLPAIICFIIFTEKLTKYYRIVEKSETNIQERLSQINAQQSGGFLPYISLVFIGIIISCGYGSILGTVNSNLSGQPDELIQKVVNDENTIVQEYSQQRQQFFLKKITLSEFAQWLESTHIYSLKKLQHDLLALRICGIVNKGWFVRMTDITNDRIVSCELYLEANKKQSLELLLKADARQALIAAKILWYKIIYGEQTTEDELYSGLWSAVMANDISLADFFITHGAEINRRNNVGKTPIQLAKGLNNQDMVDFLLSQGAEDLPGPDFNNQENTSDNTSSNSLPPQRAKTLAKIDELEMDAMEDWGVQFDKFSNSQLSNHDFDNWIINTHLPDWQELAGIINELKKETDIQEILDSPYFKFIEELTNERIEYCKELHSALEKDSEELYAQAILKVFNCFLKVGLFKLQNNMELSQEQIQGYFVLAITLGDINALKLFVKAGADIHAKDPDGNTPLDIAKSYDNKEIIEFLNSLEDKEK